MHDNKKVRPQELQKKDAVSRTTNPRLKKNARIYSRGESINRQFRSLILIPQFARIHPVNFLVMAGGFGLQAFSLFCYAALFRRALPHANDFRLSA